MQSRRSPLVGLAAAPLNGAAAPALADLPDADRQILAIDAKIAALDEKYEAVMAATRPFEDAREELRCKLDGWSFRPVNGLPASRSTLSVANTLRAKGNDLPGDLLRHVALQIWGHINLIGTYDRARRGRRAESSDSSGSRNPPSWPHEAANPAEQPVRSPFMDSGHLRTTLATTPYCSVMEGWNASGQAPLLIFAAPD